MRGVIYQLKKDYGKPLVLRRAIVNTVDVANGTIQRNYEVQKVRKAVILPGTLSRSFVYDLTYVAANKNFAYGGYFDKTTLTIILGLRDIIGDITIEWHAVIGNKRYEIVNVDKSDDAYVIQVKYIEGSDTVDDPTAINQ